MPERLSIHCFGAPVIELDGGAVTGFDSRKVVALLVYLACTGRVHPREVLAEFFWEGRTQSQALANLRVALASLRQYVDPFLLITRDSVGMNPDAAWTLDVNRFTALSRSDTVQHWQDAVTVYEGDFLSGFYVDSDSFEEWARLERERMRLSFMSVLDRLVSQSIASAQYQSGVTHATRLLHIDPLREETHRQLMQLLALSGQRAAALEQYERCRQMLADELGVEPTQETTALFEQIRSGEEVVVVPEHQAAVSGAPLKNPYKGLRAFHESDAEDFFGRETLTERLLQRMAEDGPFSRFLAVVGPSGSGKSSAVRAGLLPALREGALPGSEAWCIVDIVPGSHPLEELEIALARMAGDPTLALMEQIRRDSRGLLRAARLCAPDDASSVLLIIDQFEEVFTLVPDQAEAKFVLDSLYAAVTEPRSPLRIVITLRADFYDRPLMYPDFSEMVRQRTEAITPLNTEELERAVSGPAERVGVALEGGLATAIVADVSEQPGVLPMLQYALTELFDNRANHTLTHETYRQIGGALGALARRADAVYTGLPSGAQETARQVFLRLVTLGEGTEDIRRRALQSEIRAVANGYMSDVLDAFDHSRLLTFDKDLATGEPTVELAHEAIIREWRMLRSWLDESRDDLRLQRLLAHAASEWESAVGDESYLLAGSRLAQFSEWSAQTSVALTEDERSFLESSIAADGRRVALRRRLRNTVLAVAVIVFVAVAGMALIAVDREQQAQEARTISMANAAYAQELALVNGAQAALAQEDIDTALALASVAGQGPQPSSQAQRVLSDAAYSPGVIRDLDVGHVQTLITADLLPDGRGVSSSWGGTVSIWDVETGEVLHELVNYPDGWTVAFPSPDGKTIVVGTGSMRGAMETTLTVWNAETGEQIGSLTTEPILTLSYLPAGFSPDGKWFVGSNGGGFPAEGGEPKLILWDASTGQVDRTIEGFEIGITGAAFSPDMKTIFVVLDDLTMALVDVETGEITQKFGESQDRFTTGWFNKILFTPDGKQVITVRTTGQAFVWDLETLQEVRHIEVGLAAIMGTADLSSDGRYLAAGSDMSAGLWDVATGRQVGAWQGTVTAIDLFPDGHTILAGTGYGRLKFVDLQHGAQLKRFDEMGSVWEWYPSIALSADGSKLTACVDGVTEPDTNTTCQVVLVDVATGRLISRLGDRITGPAMAGLKFSPDGQRVLASTSDLDRTTLIVWDAGTGQEVYRYEDDAKRNPFTQGTLSPDNNTLLLTELNGAVRLVDMRTGQVLHRMEGHTYQINSGLFSADGRTALTSSQDGNVILWDVEAGQEIHRFEHGIAVNNAVFSPDGTHILTASDDMLVRIWDVDSGREVSRLVGHTSGVNDAQFSPDGQTIISTGWQENVLLWNVATGEVIRRYPGSSAWRIALSPDASSFFIPVGGEDNAIYQYRIDVHQELLDWISENRTIRELTCAEREQYRLPPYCADDAMTGS